MSFLEKIRTRLGYGLYLKLFGCRVRIGLAAEIFEIQKGEKMDISLKQAYDLFMSDRATFCKDRTLQYYEENLELFFRFLETENLSPEHSLVSLPDNIFSKYVKYLRTKKRFDGHPNFDESEYISSNTVRTYCRSVRAFFHYCNDEGFCKNYVKGVKLPREDSKQIVPLYQDEVDMIDSGFRGNSEQALRNYSMFHLMIDEGFRASEVIDLTIQDIDFNRNILIINLSKNQKSRILPLSARLKPKLLKYVTIYRSDAKGKDKVFLSLKNRQPINYNVIKQFFFRLKKKYDIPRLHPHLLRHTFATSFIMGGGNLEFLRILMGHCDYSVTKIYLHLASQYTMLQANIYQLDQVFFRRAY